MLLELRVSNFGIIEQIHWQPGQGLNVITGETGAGKSLVIDAVEGVGSTDAIETKNNFLDFIKHITKDLRKLNKIKKRNFYFIGHSLGGLFGMIIADKIDVKKMVLLVPGYNLAEAFWHSKSKQTTFCREQMIKNGMTLKKLKELWKTISPDHYFHKKAIKSEYYIKLSKKDKVIPYKNGLELIKKLEKKKTHMILKTSYLPHTLTVVFYTIFPKEIIRFLKK